MAYTSIEWMALILIAVSVIKILVILVNPKAWNDKVIKKVWKNSGLMMIISLILAGISLYYLNQAGITIVQILAVMLFLAFLMAVGVAGYSKEIVELASKMLKNKSVVKKSWLYIIIWIALLAWGAKVILF